MSVTVYDRIPHTASVTPAQALSYLRRVLVHDRGWSERQEGRGREGVISHGFKGPDSAFVRVCVRDDYADYEVRMAELCDDLVRLGVVWQPSMALRGMAEERI